MRSTVLLVTAAITGYAANSHAQVQRAVTTFQEPPAVASKNGVLRIELKAAPSTVNVAGRQATLMLYNGLYLPPTLHARPGDTLRIRLINQLNEQTNLHTHGLTVSPRGNSDNIFLHVAPGQTQDYEVRLPANQRSGLFWYHPHPHGFSDEQVRNGMSGALIVDGLLDSIPALRDVAERVLLLKDLQVDSGHAAIISIGKNTVRTINGLVNPVIVMRPGETQLWRVANIGADLYYSLGLDGH
ncbi:MAG TPA: multicopper oxidase domain-containing protein, partial [Gemmatimonadaceae bacterium]